MSIYLDIHVNFKKSIYKDFLYNSNNGFLEADHNQEYQAMSDDKAEERRTGANSSGRRLDPVKIIVNDSNESKELWTEVFPLNGNKECVKNVKPEPYIYIAVEDKDGNNSLALYVDASEASFFIQEESDGSCKELQCKPSIMEKGKVSLWYSYDYDKMVLKYGKGDWKTEENTILQHDFLEGTNDESKQEERKKKRPFFNSELVKYVRQYGNFKKDEGSALEGVNATVTVFTKRMMLKK